MRSLVTSCVVVAGCCLAIALTARPILADTQRNSASDSAVDQKSATASPQPVTMPPTTTPRVAPRPFIPSRISQQPQMSATNQSPNAPGFFGGSARARLSQLPRRAAIQAAPPQFTRGQTKPFETIHREPTVSPYLNLYRDEDDSEGAPNYFAFVRPQQEQIETNRRHQHEMQQLRGQLRGISSTIAGPQYTGAAQPATGSRSRYMDTAQFYGGWQR
jgi:hypothetical protein